MRRPMHFRNWGRLIRLFSPLFYFSFEMENGRVEMEKECRLVYLWADFSILAGMSWCLFLLSPPPAIVGK